MTKNNKTENSLSIIDEVINTELEKISSEYSLPEKLPKANISENEQSIYIHLQLFGFDPKYINLQKKGDTLVIEGHTKEETQNSPPIFAGQFRFPWFADMDHISASSAEDEIMISIPKRKEDQKTEKIPIL